MSDTEQLIEEKPVEDGSQQENYEMDSSVGEGEKRSTAEIETEAATTSGTDCEIYTVEEAIEKFGFGPFQVLVTVFCGLLWLADAMELMLLSVLSPAVQCEWGLTPTEEATITSIVFVGFLIGGVFWGAVCDIIGRKKGLLIVDIIILLFGVLSAVRVAPDDPSGKAFGYPWLLICRFGVGIGAGGTSQAPSLPLHSFGRVTYYAEFLPKKARGCCITFIEVWWAVGSMFGALLALAVMDSLGWHWYLGLATIPLFGVLFIFPFVPESARYYIVKGKQDKALQVIRRVAWYNRKPVPTGQVVSVEKKEATTTKKKFGEMSVSYSQDKGVKFVEDIPPSSSPTLEETPLLEEDIEEDGLSPSNKKGGVYQQLYDQILIYRQMLTGGMWKTTVLLWTIWLGCAWLYYGIVLLTTSILQHDYHCLSGSSSSVNETSNTSNATICNRLGNEDYLKIFWTAVAELPGLLVTILIIEILGRKKTMALEFAVTMVGFLLLYICTKPIITTLFLFVIRAFATGVFQAVYVYTPEVYTTSIRSSALGIHTGAARVGALLTPYNAQVLLHKNDYAAIALYAGSCLLLAIAALLLPIETKGKSMKDGISH